MNKNLEYISKPLLILIVTISISLFVYFKGFNLVSETKGKLDNNNKVKNQLQQKVDVLSLVDQVVTSDTTFLDVVLPNKGSVLYGMSHIKSQAAFYNILTSGLKTGISIPEKGDVYKTSISFEAEGEENSIYEFLNSFSSLIPLMNVEKVSLNKADTSVRASVTLSVYSADRPKKIPSVSDPIKELTKEEIDILKEVSVYKLPDFVEPSAQEQQQPRVNPFEAI